MQDTLKKYRACILLVLGFYIALASFQPLLHTHTEQHAIQVHAHVECETHWHVHSDPSSSSSETQESEQLLAIAGNGFPHPETIHLALEGSPIAVYHTAQKVICKIASAAFGLPSESMRGLPLPSDQVVFILDHNRLVPVKPYIITSLTDLSPPVA